ncbi:MAG: hypothetical protein ACP5I8_11100 [Phycisphaerae bacterium]
MGRFGRSWKNPVGGLWLSVALLLRQKHTRPRRWWSADGSQRGAVLTHGECNG